MAKTTILHFLEAVSVELRIDRDEGEAHLHFLGPEIAPTVVTIPLAQLERLHASILERIEQTPTLFAHRSLRKPR